MMRCDFISVLSGIILLAIHCITSGEAISAEIVIIPKSDPTQAVIVISGQLASGDEDKFKSKTNYINNATVIMQSPGGNLLAGLEIGKIIWQKHFTTLVQDGNYCASACAIAWLGGRIKYLTNEARVGFHAAYIQEGKNQKETGLGNALVGAYLTSIGLPESAVIYITAAPPSDIQWLSFEDSIKYGIDATFLRQTEEVALILNSITSQNQTSQRWQKNDNCHIPKRVIGLSLKGCVLEYNGQMTGFSLVLPSKWTAELTDNVIRATSSDGMEGIRIQIFGWDGKLPLRIDFHIDGLTSTNYARIANYPATIGYATSNGWLFRVAMVAKCDQRIQLVYSSQDRNNIDDVFSRIAESITFKSTC